MRRLKPWLAVLLLMATGFAGADAALTPGTVDRWLNSMQEFREWTDQRAQTVEAVADPGDPQVDMERMLARAARDSEEVDALIRRNGFDDRQHWAGVGSRIFNAYVALRMQERAPEMERQMEESIRQIDESPYMEEEQKEMLRQQMRRSHQQFARGHENLPPGDLEAVRARQDALAAWFDDN